MDNRTLLEHLDQLGQPTIVVVGDLILDRYTWGDADRSSPEAPVLVLRADVEEVRLGGAASVAMLLRALDASVSLVGVVGDDAAGRTVQKLCQDDGIDFSGVYVDQARLTTTKERLMGRAANRHPQQMLRVDRECTAPIPTRLEQQLLDVITERLGECDALVVSDYAKGVCTPSLLAEAIGEARKRLIPVFVDPGRIKDYAKYRDATVLTPNRAEAALVTGHEVVTVDDAKLAAREICSGFDVDTVLLKLDSEGIVLAHGGHARHCPTRRREVYDVTGAGDMVLAMVSLCRACGFEWRETAHLANLAAGTEIERLGVAPVTKDELRAQLASRLEYHRRKLCTLDELVLLRERYRNQNKNVVFTNGCFDLLHIGHVSYLQQAKELGDVLIVAINSDECVQRLKGPARPIIDEFARAALLAALDCVDHVVVFSEDTPHSLLSALRPEYLVKGGTYGLSEVVGHDIVEAYGGQVRVLDKWEGVSTTSIVTRCQTVS